MKYDELVDLVNAQPIGTMFIWRTHVLRKVEMQKLGHHPGHWVRLSPIGRGAKVSDLPILNAMSDELGPWSFS